MGIREICAEKGITLPAPPKAVAAYVPYLINENLLAISGVLPFREGKLAATGRVGREVLLPEAQECARLCGIQLLAVLAAVEEEGRQVEQVLRVTGFVASAPEFMEQHLVMNACSELLVEVLGDRGRHTREAVGVVSLPLNAPVEVSAWVRIR